VNENYMRLYRNHVGDNFVLYESIAEGLKQKVTLSGNQKNQYISSSSLRIANMNVQYNADLKIKNEALLNLASNSINVQEQHSNKGQTVTAHGIEKIGFRVGYGHS